MPLVIDASVVLSWCLSDEDDPLAELAMRLTLEHFAVVPRIWWYEILNALSVNRRRGRLREDDVSATLADLKGMRILADDDHSDGVILDLVRRHGLSAYDAAYLETALRRSLPLASLDRRLRRAAEAAGATILRAR
ncbi:type II toxin-antitoxin system VapC family toxin [Candidatus Palauibacter sp.]|uniref:type II toxin-antitoxin system VapC family toxin n=1 Tax=Candidatus Palauibacter sp. TaxID=3101350 RepID=UPI003AF1ED7A